MILIASLLCCSNSRYEIGGKATKVELQITQLGHTANLIGELELLRARRNDHPIFGLDWRSSHTGHLPKNNCVDHYRSEQIT